MSKDAKKIFLLHSLILVKLLTESGETDWSLKSTKRGLRGGMIRIIENMYRTIEYGVKCQGGITPFFSSSLGVRTLSRHYSIFLSMTSEIFLRGISGFRVGEKEVTCMQMT